MIKPSSAESLKPLHHGYYTMVYWSSAASQDQMDLEKKKHGREKPQKFFFSLTLPFKGPGGNSQIY